MNRISKTWTFARDDLLVLPKMLYFSLNLVVYSVHAFQAQFFMDAWNLPIYKFGYISSLQGFNFFGALLWSHAADRVGRPKLIISGCALAYCGLMCGLLLPAFDGPERKLLKSFYAAILNGSAQFFLAGCFPLLDALILAVLAKNPRNSKEIFGKQRLWGTFGHASATYLSVYAIEVADYQGMYGLLAICTFAFITIVYLGIPATIDIRKSSHHHRQASAAEKSRSAEQAAGHEQTDKKSAPSPTTAEVEGTASAVDAESPPTTRLLKNPHFLFFIAFILVAGYVRSIMTNFQSYFIERVLHQDKRVVGHAGAARVITEVGVFFFGKQLMASIGPYWMLLFSQLAGIGRVLGYALIPVGAPGWEKLIYPLELLKGLNTGLIVSSAVRLAHDIAPPDCSNTAQGLFSGVYTGLATALGGILGGWLIYVFWETATVPMQAMFRVSAGIAAVMTLLFAVKYAVVDRVICTRGGGHGSSASRASS